MQHLNSDVPPAFDAWKEQIFDADQALVLAAADGHPLGINDAAIHLLGLPAASDAHASPAVQQLSRRLAASGSNESPAQFRWRLGTGRHSEVQAVRLHFGTRTMLLGLLGKTDDASAAKPQVLQLTSFIDAILNAGDLSAGVGALLHLASEHGSWSYAEAWVPNGGDDCLAPVHFHWSDARFAGLARAMNDMRITPGQGMPGRVWESGLPEWRTDFPDGDDVSPRRQALRATGLRAACAIPLRNEGRVVCVLAFFFETSSRADRVLLEVVARSGNLLGMVLAHRRTAQSLQERDALLQSMFDHLPCSVYRRVLHPDGRITYPYVGGRLLPSLGVSTGSSYPDVVTALAPIHSDDREELVRDIYRSAREHSPLNVDYRVTGVGGETRWVRSYSAPRQEDGTIIWDCFLLDITEEQRLRQVADEQAQRDGVTQLPTRPVLESGLAQMLNTAGRRGDMLAVLLFNVDRFRWINDAYGMSAGDAVLAAIAERLRNTLPADSLLARIASDEFALAVGGISDDLQLRRHLAILKRVMNEPFKVFDQEIQLTYTSGLSLYPDDAQQADELVRNASLAMHRGRRENKGKLTRFVTDVDRESTAVMGIERELRIALRERQFEVHYQPQVAPSFERLTGFEALVRWRHPERGMVPPNRFIAIAEEAGLIDELFLQVLDEVCRQHAAWQQAGLSPPPVSVNLSPVQMRPDNTIAASVGRALHAHGISAKSLKLEITEGTLLRNFETGTTLLDQLGTLGVPVVLDDFGVGYSSLGYLAQLPVRSIKIDRSFVVGLEQNANAGKILRAVIALAHSLSMDVTVEGVETERQLATIRQWNCHGIQGYLFSKPLPAPETEALLRRMR